MSQNQKYSFDVLEEALALLGQRLLLRAAAPQHLVVCGGSALNALYLNRRVTEDVDVVAITDSGHGSLKSAKPLSTDLTEVVLEVAEDLGIHKNWLNNGPADIFDHGLPEGLLERLLVRKYSDSLVIHYTARLDLIHFKLDAAVQNYSRWRPVMQERHAADLIVLQPSDEELLRAARWSATQDGSSEHPRNIAYFLNEFGRLEVANGFLRSEGLI